MEKEITPLRSADLKLLSVTIVVVLVTYLLFAGLVRVLDVEITPRSLLKDEIKYVAVDDSSSDEVSIKQIYALGSKKTQPFHVDVLVNNQPLKMELDTGAAVSIIAESQLKRILPRIKLKPSKIKLETYSGEKMPVVGEVPVEVQYAEQTELLSFVVVAQEGPHLLGRDWLKMSAVRLEGSRCCAFR